MSKIKKAISALALCAKMTFFIVKIRVAGLFFSSRELGCSLCSGELRSLSLGSSLA